MVSSFGETFREPNLKLFVKDVREGKKRPIEVRSWSTIQNVKEILQRKIQVPTSSIRLFFGPLLTSGQELPNHRTLHDVGIYRSGETILLDIKNSADRTAPPLHSSKSSVDIQISASMMESTPKALRSLVTQARRGLSLGFKPDLVLDGSGGTYILHDPCKRNIAVFKPSDEEPYAANNPRGYLRQPKDASMALRAGVTPGEACMREVAAYLLDKDGFSGVPQTTLVEARHPTFNTNGARLNVSQGGASLGAHSIAPLSPVKPSPVANKAGSFQEFVNCECTIDDISPSKISAKEVHKIAILDIRIMNSDRNSANLLVRRRRNNSLELVPIDHGFCLRSVCDVCWMDWCWLDWPQLKEPLCDDHKSYIMGLDVESEARMLRDQLNICEEAVDYFRASSALLKAGVAAGLSLYEIAIKCCRNDNLAEVPSMMEKLFDMASDLAQVAVQNDRYHHSTASRALVDQLSPSAEALWQIKPPARPASRRFGRSVSNAELESSHSTNSDRSLYKHQELAEEEPDMAHSSVSDSCSETEVNDHTNEDECNKWAGKIIADLSEPWSATRTHRASSIASSDASILSSSPGGFWTIPPGTVDLKASDEDDSVQWSPRSNEPRCQATGFENVEPPPLTIGDAAKSVTFSDTDFPFMLPDSLEPLQPKAVAFVDTDAIPETKVSCITPAATSNMKRSKSYTAMPAGGPRKTDIPVAQRGPDKFSVQYTQYKKYFHNFIDLVIVQETTSALARS